MSFRWSMSSLVTPPPSHIGHQTLKFSKRLGFKVKQRLSNRGSSRGYPTPYGHNNTAHTNETTTRPSEL